MNVSDAMTRAMGLAAAGQEMTEDQIAILVLASEVDQLWQLIGQVDGALLSARHTLQQAVRSKWPLISVGELSGESPAL